MNTVLPGRHVFVSAISLTISLAVALLTLTVPARADIVTRESDITALRLGQRVYVDDGSCPAGRIKEIAGVKLSATGILRTRNCVERKGKR